MKAAGVFLTALVVLAVAQAAAAVLYVALLLGLLIGVFAYPRETFGLLAFCLVASLVERAPLAFLSLAALIVIRAIISDRKRS